MKKDKSMTELLRIEDAESIKPEKLQGDIYCSPDQLAFVAFKRGRLSPLFFVLFNVFWFIIRAQKMEAWRDSLRGKSIDQMVQENEGSWVLQRGDIREMKRSFPATLTVTTVAGSQYKLQVPRFSDFKEFATRNHFPLS